MDDSLGPCGIVQHEVLNSHFNFHFNFHFNSNKNTLLYDQLFNRHPFVQTWHEEDKASGAGGTEQIFSLIVGK